MRPGAGGRLGPDDHRRGIEIQVRHLAIDDLHTKLGCFIVKTGGELGAGGRTRRRIAVQFPYVHHKAAWQLTLYDPYCKAHSSAMVCGGQPADPCPDYNDV